MDAVRPDDMDRTVRPGVTRRRPNGEPRATGLVFRVDQATGAALGGMVATGASATDAARRGTIREQKPGPRAVPPGEAIRTSGRARESSAVCDPTRRVIGSEGTLGIVAEITLRLQGAPRR